jgi:hypothetical protein
MGATDHQERRGKPMSAKTDPSRPRNSTMPPTEQTDQDPRLDLQTSDRLNDLIAQQVVQSLGSPADLLKVQVRPLGGLRYRVNVFVGKYGVAARIADSFFLATDEQGQIVTSSPAIARLY